ncbi:hypothetical protein [Chitinolyticbacter albus]|uniref:hypothetical protein n=1 Tax=Chitinolyticbacter albus TaxID=2961951 RepID=UPI00210F1EB6|nr:hypothetical protein [Chitinolyticbacter albus]
MPSTDHTFFNAMARTSLRRIPLAQEFVRIGFGNSIDPEAAFCSNEFLTEVLTTIELQAVLPIVKQFNQFNGDKVAAAVERFRGQVQGWKFGCAGSPLLIAVLPYWTHQVEDYPLVGEVGVRISEESLECLVAEMRQVFLHELHADKFDRDGSSHAYGAWWD